MTVFKYFLKIAWQYKMNIVVYTVIFFVLSILMTSQMIQETTFGSTKINIIVTLPKESSVLTDHLIEYLDNTHNITISTDSKEELKEKVYTGMFDAAIIMEEPLETILDEEQNLLNVITNAQSSVSSLLEVELNQYFLFAKTQYQATNKVNIEMLDKIMNTHSQVTVISNSENNSKDLWLNNWSTFYFKFLSYVLVSIFISFFGILIANFEEDGVKTRIQLGAISLVKVNLLKLLGSAVVTIIIGIIFIAGAILMQPNLINNQNFYHHLLIMSISMLTILSLTYLCVIIAKSNKNVLPGLSLTIGLGLSFISGVFVPLEIINENVLKIAKLFPVYYITKAHEAILINQNYAQYVIILLSFAIFYFILALTVLRIHQTHQ